VEVGYGGGNVSVWRRAVQISFGSGRLDLGKRFGSEDSWKEVIGNEDSGVRESGIVEGNAVVDGDSILEQ
jgi:hypothetical protein